MSDLYPCLSKKQYSLPGRGSPMFIARIFDEVFRLISLGKKVLLVFWDSSSAFTVWNGSYGVTQEQKNLMLEFLTQTTTMVKTADKNGHHLSDFYHTDNGSCQGQIMADTCFILLNDPIEPLPDDPGENNSEPPVQTSRSKYVDDWSDLMHGLCADKIFQCFRKNMEFLIKCCSSIGVKLNDDKTAMLPFNFTDNELPAEYKKQPGEVGARFVSETVFLGFGIQVKNGKPCVQPAVEECIARLKSSSAEITTLRKIQKSTLVYRLKAAVKTVHSALYDLGNIYAFCTENDWHRIVKSIHGVLKDAGLDRRTPSKILYKLTLKIPPNFMARKHLIQNALKDADLNFIRNNRYLIDKSKEGNQPFFDKFRYYFNEIDLRTRKKIIDTYHPMEKTCVEKVKDLLYSYFLKKFAPGGELSEKRILVLSNKYKYSYEKVNERKRKSKKGSPQSSPVAPTPPLAAPAKRIRLRRSPKNQQPTVPRVIATVRPPELRSTPAISKSRKRMGSGSESTPRKQLKITQFFQ